MKIGIITGGFPVISETFVVNHALSVIPFGIDPVVFPRGHCDWSVPTVSGAQEALQHRVAPLAAQGGAISRATAAAWSGISDTLTGGIGFRQWQQAMRHRSLRSLLPLIRQARVIRRQANLSLLHAHFGVHGVFAANLRHLGVRAPLITTFHGFDILVGQDKQLAGKYEELFRVGDAFTANSPYTAERLEALGCPKDKIHLWRMGVDADRFHFQERHLPADGPVNLITVARLIPQKGVDTIIAALAKVTWNQRPLRLHVVGGGDELFAQELKRAVHELGLDDTVIFHGPQSPERVAQLLGEAQIFILASRTADTGWRETQGVVLQEAQACGLPVITTRSGGIPYSVAEGDSALLTPENDSDALAAAIDELLARHESWPSMGRNGRRLVEKEFDLERQAKKIVSVYEQVTSAC